MTAVTSPLPATDRDGRPAPPPGRRRRRLVLVIALVMAVAVAATWLLAFSSVFGMRSVDVRGTRTLTAGQVENAAGIERGTPLVRLDTAAVTARVERLPAVESAQVSTSFPSTVLITVEERTPVGYLRVGGRDVLVDHTGYQYRGAGAAPENLPRFVVPAGTDARTTGGAVATVAAALPVALLAKVKSIEALDPVAITLVLRGRRTVRWGGADRSADKARILPVLLAHKGTQFDVSDPDQPFTR